MAGSIKNDIRQGNVSGVYLVWGDEEFLRDYYKNQLLSKILDKDFADFNFKQYSEKKPDTDEIEEFFAVYPFMSDRKILYIKDSGIFKKVSEDEKKFYLEFLNDLPPFATIIFSEKSVDKRNALYKLVSTKFACDEFPFQKRPALISWVIRYFAKHEKNISDNDADYLIECCSESMCILKNEIEKLVYYKPDAKFIKKEDIDKCACKIPESRVFKMIDDILEGNKIGAKEKFEELKLLKEEPIALCSAVFSKYSQIRKEKLMSKTLSAREIAAKTNQKEYFVNLNLKKAKNLSVEKIDEVLKTCQMLDYKVKSGLSDSWTEFEIIFATMAK